MYIPKLAPLSLDLKYISQEYVHHMHLIVPFPIQLILPWFNFCGYDTCVFAE